MADFDWDDVTDIRRDHWGRPLVVPPGGTKPTAYTRCTTYAGTVEDTYNLQRWMQRMVALGLAERPDLMVSVAAHYDAKDELNKICETAIEAAKGKAAAGVGTALHKLTDRLDRGEPLGPVPAEYEADLAAFYKATEPLTVRAMERFVVLDELKIGGTFDRLYEVDGRRYIGDTKSGNIEYGTGKIAMQLAIYSRSVAYDHRTQTRAPLDVNQDRALVVHLPAGVGRCELHWIDIAAGWEAVQLAVDVRRWRARRNLLTPYGHDPLGRLKRTLNRRTEDPRETGMERHSDLSEQKTEQKWLNSRIDNATSVDHLTRIWAEANAAGYWTPELTALAAARKQALLAEQSP